MPNTNEAWSEEEDNALAALYPGGSQMELMKAFPRFSWYRICDRAKEHGIRRALAPQGRARVNIYHRTVSYQDLERVAALGQELDEKERLQEMTNDLAARTKRGELSAHWWLPLDEISYLSLLDDMGNYLNDGSTQDGSRRPDGLPRHLACYSR